MAKPTLFWIWALIPTVRKIGEKGIRVTRFKGLGEMDAEQLWGNYHGSRTSHFVQVRLDDVAAANDLFATLMGDDVEPRREFIENTRSRSRISMSKLMLVCNSR